MTHYQNADLSRIVHSGGPLTRVFAKCPVDEIAALPPGPRLRAITRALQLAGAPESDIGTVTAVLENRSADRKRVPRLLLIHDGDLLLDEPVPDATLQSDETSFDQVPMLIPLVSQRQRDFSYVVVEANAEGARIRTFCAGDPHADIDERVTGETEHLHEAHGGGFSHFRHAHHTEEVWKQNEEEVADEVNRLVEQGELRLVVVTGDPHVVELLGNALSSRARSILATLASDTIAAGASADKLNSFVAQQLRRISQAHEVERIGRAAAQASANGSEADLRLQPIVHALQQAAVETLLLDLEALEPHTLLSLAGKPWVSAVAAETFGAATIGAGPAAEALARAAIATDAEVLIVEPGTLPGGAAAAVVRR